jgi:ribokinase
MTLPPEILVVGSANVDLVAEVPHLPGPGETVLGSRLTVHEGGKGANQAVAAARAGGSVAMVCAVGRDAYGERLRASLAGAGVSTTHVHSTDTGTGTALICVDAAGQNCIAVVPGANGLLAPEQVEDAVAALPRLRTMLLQLEVPRETVVAAAELGVARGLRVILNPAPAAPLDGALLSYVDVLTPNESEAALLTGMKVVGVERAVAAAERLLETGVRAVVVTLGADGAFVATREGDRSHVPAFAAAVVDTTAAGDVFNGALAVALTDGRPLEEAVRFACAAGAISVTRDGAQRSAPTRAEIDAVLAGTPISAL